MPVPAKIVPRQRAGCAQAHRLDTDQPQQGVGKSARHVFFLLLVLPNSTGYQLSTIVK
jgi:hypothetical protein